MTKVTQTWHSLPSGVLIPSGNVTDTSASSKSSYLQIKEKANAVEALYAESGLSISPTSSFAHLISNAKNLWENLILDKLSYEMVFRGIHFDRIADAVLPLSNHPNRTEYLQKLLSGSLAFFEREPSRAKDFFWEIELWSRLQHKIPQTNLQDPPDIIINLEDTMIGIACKKFYSENHVQHVLSKGVHQIEPSFEFGIVCCNLDDLLPNDVIGIFRNEKHLEEVLQSHNHEFIKRHEYHIRRYLTDERLIAIFVSTTVIADIMNMKPRLHNASQWTIWTLEDINEKYKRQIYRLHKLVMN